MLILGLIIAVISGIAFSWSAMRFINYSVERIMLTEKGISDYPSRYRHLTILIFIIGLIALFTASYIFSKI